MVDGESVDGETSVVVTPALSVRGDFVEFTSDAPVVEREINSIRKKLEFVLNPENKDNYNKRKLSHLTFADIGNDANEGVTNQFKLRAARLNNFAVEFKEGRLQDKASVVLEINQFMSELWSQVASAAILAKPETVQLTRGQYLDVLDALGPLFRQSCSALSLLAHYPGTYERMIEAYTYPDKDNNDPDKLNLWSDIHCMCEAAVAVRSRTDVTTKGATIKHKEKEIIVKGAIQEVQDRIEAKQDQIVLKDVPCGSGEWTMRILQSLLTDNSNLVSSEQKMLFLLRDISSDALHSTIKRFEQFLIDQGLSPTFEPSEARSNIKGFFDDEKNEHVMVTLKVGGLEFNFAKKDEREGNGDEHADTKVDVRATLGVWDYFPKKSKKNLEEDDEKFVKGSFRRAIVAMKDGATAYFGQFMDNYPDEKYMGVAMDWKLVTRSEKELHEILDPIASELGVDIDIFTTPGAEKTQLLVQVRKPIKAIKEN